MKSRLGRFGHHQDPAIDFHTEVAEQEALFYDVDHGLFEGEELDFKMEEMSFRLGRALDFKVGGDENSVSAMERLRKVHDNFTNFLTSKRFADFKKAVVDGNVVTTLPKTDDDVLLDDGHGRVSVNDDTALMGVPLFSFCLSDPGGFSSVSFNKEDWEKMKVKVDAIISKAVQ